MTCLGRTLLQPYTKYYCFVFTKKDGTLRFKYTTVANSYGAAEVHNHKYTVLA